MNDWRCIFSCSTAKLSRELHGEPSSILWPGTARLHPGAPTGTQRAPDPRPQPALQGLNSRACPALPKQAVSKEKEWVGLKAASNAPEPTGNSALAAQGSQCPRWTWDGSAGARRAPARQGMGLLLGELGKAGSSWWPYSERDLQANGSLAPS